MHFMISIVFNDTILKSLYKRGVIKLANRIVPGISLGVLGALISIAPNYLVCQHCMKMGMKCAGSVKIEFGIGIIVLILTLLLFFFVSREIRLGISISLTLIGIFSALVSTVLSGFCNGSCGNADCTCSPFTTPIMTTLSILVVLVALFNSMFLSKTKNS
jgi:hypothetical protein